MHNCTNKQPGHRVCAEHTLHKDGVRYRFRKHMQEVVPIDELLRWRELMLATMLPRTRMLPLDDCPQSYIDRVTKGGANA